MSYFIPHAIRTDIGLVRWIGHYPGRSGSSPIRSLTALWKRCLHPRYRSVVCTETLEHGARFDPDQVVEVNAIRTARTMTFRVRDPGAGFRKEEVTHAAHANSPDDPLAHIVRRQQQGMRACGYGMLLAAGTVDELIYNETGNEVLLIKYLD